MARYRKIQTGVKSERDLARALAEMGLKGVEVHADAQPLNDWIGRPTEVLANVIVRRAFLGASSDDIGFARNANGTFELVLSDIHLFKFDRRWLDELARRTGTESVALGPVNYAAANTSHANPTHTKPPPVPVMPREQNLEQRARLESVEMLERAKKTQSLWKTSCLLYFLPVLPWALLQLSSVTATGVPVLVLIMALWSMIYFVGIALVVTTRLRNVAREFSKRFPTREERTAALAQLKVVADDKQHAAADAAKKFLTEIERQAAGAITRLPTTSNREPGEKGR
ncbi:MAG: DUF1257 domain-containing protein [Planctomycetota bacterium]|nr:DUF1257 domain-containing protein [Planctomycetota bacterium]